MLNHVESVTFRSNSSMLQACNPLGGAESCMTLPADSKFAQVCPGHDLKVSLGHAKLLYYCKAHSHRDTAMPYSALDRGLRLSNTICQLAQLCSNFEHVNRVADNQTGVQGGSYALLEQSATAEFHSWEAAEVLACTVCSYHHQC